ncbi:hypothetical protein OG429_01450 [Streptomyces sp. NBC_00190]|uniref:hypothetical protein n=1 Tax=unclassified Streptomyces TaxID=2593676 RepID=UPI002E2CCA69|nr:hypothetical protein [Streptomyces sp. NBC_00190]WSZ38115.1 hypothetical protein OG239_04440 [Streptomyces sp. NBC_00868]
MADDTSPTIEATLYDATNYEGTAVHVQPDKCDEEEDAVAYALAYLGLRRLGSLRAPTGPADLDDPFRQELGWVTHVTVWESRPETWAHDADGQGRTWQDYSADTADLGLWAAKATYVRVWKQTAADFSGTDSFTSDGAMSPIVIVE